MKKNLLFCLTLIFFSSCSLNNDNTGFSVEVLAVNSVDIPEAFELGETYPITISYLKPTSCHAFKEFYYLKENNERTVAPINYFFQNNNCENLEKDNLTESTFNFKVTSNGSYVFKFWQGKDTNGESQFLIIEVPVIEI